MSADAVTLVTSICQLPSTPGMGLATSAKYQCAAVEISFWQSWVIVTGCEKVTSTVVLFTVLTSVTASGTL